MGGERGVQADFANVLLSKADKPLGEVSEAPFRPDEQHVQPKKQMSGGARSVNHKTQYGMNTSRHQNTFAGAQEALYPSIRGLYPDYQPHIRALQVVQECRIKA